MVSLAVMGTVSLHMVMDNLATAMVNLPLVMENLSMANLHMAMVNLRPVFPGVIVMGNLQLPRPGDITIDSPPMTTLPRLEATETANLPV